MRTVVLVVLVLLALTSVEAVIERQPLRQASSDEARDGQGRPNILFCMADDWGWPHAGAYGDKVVKTPTFDRIAKEGVLFQNAFISSPSCTPCRNSILTGQQFYRLGSGANLWSSPEKGQPSFMFMLRDAGYEIGYWRKAYGPGKFPESPCGKYYHGLEGFLKQRDKTKPFCFWFGTSDPHRGYKKGSGAKSGINVDDVHLPDFYPDNKEIKSDIADYYFEVQRWDSDVGKALELLEREGMLENTIVVMTGDHGMPFPRCKGNLYDWGSHVPLAIQWGSKVKAGRTVTDFVSFTDFAPTFLQTAGLEVPQQMTGRSIQPLLLDSGSGRVDKNRDFVVYGRERHTPAQAYPSMDGYPSRAIRTDKWLFIINHRPDLWPAGVPTGATHGVDKFTDCDDGPTKTVLMRGKDDVEIEKSYKLCFAKRPGVELYDCESDPDQVNNLAADPTHAKTVKGLRKKLVKYLKETKDPRQIDEKVTFYEHPYLGRRVRKNSATNN